MYVGSWLLKVTCDSCSWPSSTVLPSWRPVLGLTWTLPVPSQHSQKRFWKQ